MPLRRGQASIGKNIQTEEAAGKPPAQATAIAMNVAGKSHAAPPGPKRRPLKFGSGGKPGSF